jgi:hypothetical protein
MGLVTDYLKTGKPTAAGQPFGKGTISNEKDFAGPIAYPENQLVPAQYPPDSMELWGNNSQSQPNGTTVCTE